MAELIDGREFKVAVMAIDGKILLTISLPSRAVCVPLEKVQAHRLADLLMNAKENPADSQSAG